MGKLSLAEAYETVGSVRTVTERKERVLIQALAEANRWRQHWGLEPFMDFPQGVKNSATRCPVARAIGFEANVVPLGHHTSGRVGFHPLSPEKGQVIAEDTLPEKLASTFATVLSTDPLQTHAYGAWATLPLSFALVGFLFDRGFYPWLEERDG